MAQQQAFYSPSFSQCNYSSIYMLNSTAFAEGTFREPKIPLSFGCDLLTIYIPLTVDAIPGYDDQFNVKEYEAQTFDACGNLFDWEKQINKTCIDLLCNVDEKIDNLQEYLRLNTDGTSNFTDWINACQYCNGRSEMFRKRVNAGNCKSKDELSNRMVREYPTSIYFCGEESFGLPILMPSNTLFQKYSNDFLYICNCGGFMKSKCYSDNGGDIRILYFYFASSIILFVLNTFLNVIPKTKRMIRDRKYLKILPSIYNGIFVGALSVAFGFVLFSNSLIILAFLIFYQLSFNLLQLAIFSWLSNWIRLVRIVRHNPLSLRASILLYLVPFLFSMVFGVVLPFIVASVYNQSWSATYFLTALESYLLGASIISVIAIIVSCIWIYVEMRKISDVNLLHSPFLKFSIFVIVSFTLICIGYLFHILSINLILISIDWATYIYFIISAIFSIVSLGLIIVEFDSVEFKEMYLFFKKNNHRTGSHSNSTVNSTGDISKEEEEVGETLPLNNSKSMDTYIPKN